MRKAERGRRRGVSHRRLVRMRLFTGGFTGEASGRIITVPDSRYAGAIGAALCSMAL